MRNGTTYYNRNNKEQELETEEKKREKGYQLMENPVDNRDQGQQ